jgi:hypothetical protein
MEIDANIQNQSQENLYNSNVAKNAHQNETLFENNNNTESIENNKDSAQEKNQELNSSKNKRRTYNIILRTSFDKIKTSKDNELLSSNNNNNDSTNSNTAEATSKNTTSLNSKIPNKLNKNIHQSQEESESNSKDKMLVEDEDTNNKLKEINNKDINNNQDMNKNEEDNKQERKYYNPFNGKTNNDINTQRQENCEIKCDNEKYNPKMFKMPNIILTTFQPKVKNTRENGSKLSNLWNLFSRKKEKPSQNKEELNKEEAPKDKLKTLEERLIDENIIVNDKGNNNKEEEKPIENNENIENKNIKKYNFVLGVIDSKKEGLKENKEIMKTCEEMIKEEKGKNNYDKNNSTSFIIRAEPIISNNNQEKININEPNSENNLCESSQMIEDDKSSQYTAISGISASSFMKLIKDKSKCSPLLMAILLGSCGLFYLIYKKINLKEIIAKCSELFKNRPRFLEYICSFISTCLEDFMERYNDLNRLLVGIIRLICFWFIFKLLMKKCMKRRKK